MKYKNDEKILLILDVDETLVHATKNKLNQEHDFMVGNYYVYKRPYLSEFLLKLKDHYLLAIWSSASEDYVQHIVKHIIPTSIPLEFVWSRNRCNYRRPVHYQHHFIDTSYIHTKPLKKLKRKSYHLERILIVDDTAEKCFHNYGNAIYPTPYYGEKKDNELALLADYLFAIKNYKQVRNVEKRYWRTFVNTT